MSKNSEVIQNGSGIAFVLDNQDYPPGAFKELNSKKYPSSFSVNYDKSDLISPEDMGSIDQTAIVEAIKRNLVDRSNSLDDKEKVNRFVFESVLEMIENYNGTYNAEDNSITMEEEDFDRLMDRTDNRIFGLDFLDVKFILIKDDGKKEAIYPQYDSITALNSPVSLGLGEIIEGSKSNEKPYGETLFFGTIDKYVSEINKSITEDEVKLLDQSFISIGDYLAGRQKAKFYMRIESDIDSGNVPFEIDVSKSKASGKIAIDLNIMFRKLDYFNMQDRVEAIHIWADEDQEFAGEVDSSTLKEYIESHGYKANILELNSKEDK
jgi:hypothetical protein